LLRHDGIFPSAVTLGQYTRAIAEGFSKRSVENTTSCTYAKVEIALNRLDENLSMLEEAGKRWRHRPREESPDKHHGEYTDPTASPYKKRKHHSSFTCSLFLI